MEEFKFSLVKTVNYDLKPFGNFIIKWLRPKTDKPNIISVSELSIDDNTCMPIDEKQDKEIVKFMKKHKTDILIDKYGNFYTRAGSGFCMVSHKKLREYKENNPIKSL